MYNLHAQYHTHLSSTYDKSELSFCQIVQSCRCSSGDVTRLSQPTECYHLSATRSQINYFRTEMHHQSISAHFS